MDSLNSGTGKVNLSKQTVKLQKNEKVSLTKTAAAGLNKVNVGLGWDPVGQSLNEVKPAEKKGFLSKLFSSSPTTIKKEADIDCDAWVAAFDATGKQLKVVYFGDKDWYNGSTQLIHHCGDNLTGEGEGDDEVVEIYLNNMPSEVTRITVGVTIYSAIAKHQTFDMIQNLFVRIVDTRDGFEICRFDNRDTAKNPGSISFVVGDLLREPSGWEFKASAEASKASTISEAVRQCARR